MIKLKPLAKLKSGKKARDMVDKFEGSRRTKNISVDIRGYWKNEPEEIFEKYCMIGDWDEISNDDHVFYYFSHGQEIVGDHGDFVVLEYTIY